MVSYCANRNRVFEFHFGKSLGTDIERGKMKYWDRKPVLVLLCPPQIAHVQAWD